MSGSLTRLAKTSLCAMAFAATTCVHSESHASCGSAACFLLTGEEGAVQLEGKLSVGLTYAYTISKLQSGTSGFVTSVDQEARQLVMNEHAEHRTILEVTTLDVNYGLTNNLTLELLVPYKHIKHTHIIERGSADTLGAGEYEAFQDAGIGDVRVNTKYSFLPTLRSLIVFGFGIDLPTGNSHANNINGTLQEPTLQLGHRTWGIAPSIFQSYEIIPHVLDQFARVSYQHSFTGPNSYRFGDVYVVSGGLNYKTLKILTLTGQFNWRYAVHDEFTGTLFRVPEPGTTDIFPGPLIPVDTGIKRRPVPNTGGTTLAFSPGISVQVRDQLRAYFFAQVPVVQDYNGGLIPDVSYLAGLSMSF
ncbi:MAG: hypothetical protein E6K68_05690 [Nitrospirae bacterium]|nr:MAG: hypothetical protein E6K68_05690 [Nitrospirota bacterium]